MPTKQDNEQKKKMQSICLRFNQDPNKNHLNQVLNQLIDSPNIIKIDPPIKIEMGNKLTIGERCYFNSGVTLLDSGQIEIGNDVLIGPNVQIYSVGHALNYNLRTQGENIFSKVSVGSFVWIGGGSIICPGVTIGEKSVVAAGSVVTKDVPSGTLVGGNPARVIKEI
ncbi:MAG: sugar O-acetyltransferase [Saccharospirillaceae bacterium]|nr:maltose O-acetyltransferase [Pseudomonadales bacterium]NRB80803.1 sugar O-acetyltransferase [Saccharospirillaceae bacterium]